MCVLLAVNYQLYGCKLFYYAIWYRVWQIHWHTPQQFAYVCVSRMLEKRFFYIIKTGCNLAKCHLKASADVYLMESIQQPTHLYFRTVYLNSTKVLLKCFFSKRILIERLLYRTLNRWTKIAQESKIHGAVIGSCSRNTNHSQTISRPDASLADPPALQFRQPNTCMCRKHSRTSLPYFSVGWDPSVYSVYSRNMGSSPSVTDINCNIIIRQLLDTVFNTYAINTPTGISNLLKQA
jgi:hypothetical protein